MNEIVSHIPAAPRYVVMEPMINEAGKYAGCDTKTPVLVWLVRSARIGDNDYSTSIEPITAHGIPDWPYAVGNLDSNVWSFPLDCCCDSRVDAAAHLSELVNRK